MKLASFAFLTFILCSCTSRLTESDEEAVKKVVVEFVQDFNDGSFKKAELYATEDWIHINPGGGIDVGKKNVLNRVRSVHQTFLKNVSISIDSMTVRFVTPEVALVTAHHPVDDYTTPDNVTHSNERQIKSYVMVKRNGRWLMTLDHNTVIQR